MKNYLSIILLILPFYIYPQEFQKDCINTTKTTSLEIPYDKSQTVIWSEDFANGFPAGWTKQTNTGIATCNWKWSTQGSWGYWNGNANNGSTPAAAINSTTSANGFLISDPDSANHHAYGQPSGTTYQYLDSYFITSAINTTGYPNVNLEFEQNFRFNNNVNMIVSVSNDSISWTNFLVQGDASNNQESNDPEFVNLNISCVAGNQATVYIKIGWNARCYFWMLDDMRIVEGIDNNLDILEANYGGWYTTPIANGFGLEYTRTPLSQAIANPYTFEGIVTNSGGNDQLTKLNIEVSNDIGVPIFNTSSADSIILSQDPNCNMDTVTFVGNNKFTPPSIGTYYFNTWASSADTSTTMISDEAIVSDSIYARDENDDYSEYGLGRSCGGMIIGTYFDMYDTGGMDTDDVTSISVFIKDNSVSGSVIYVALYEIDASNTKIPIAQSNDYIIQSTDLGNWVTIAFNTPVDIMPQSYMAAVGGYQHPLDTTLIGMSQYTFPTTCYIQKNGCLNSGQTAGNWYWLSRVPMIRLNTGGANTTSIYENTSIKEALTIFPNPSDGIFTLTVENIIDDTYTINILDVTGKKVFSLKKESSNRLVEDINISSFNKGIYLVEVIGSNILSRSKVTIR